jgi:hypothetical protein
MSFDFSQGTPATGKAPAPSPAGGGFDFSQGTPVTADSGAPAPAPQGFWGKLGSGIVNGAEGLGNVVIGAGKGALDTIESVPRNISKVGDAAYDVTVTPQFTDAKKRINDQNSIILDKLKQYPVGTPQHDQLLKQITQNQKSFQAVMDAEAAAKSDYEGSGLHAGVAGVDSAIAPTTGTQKFGFGAEKIGELLVPASAASDADKALKGMEVFKNGSTAAKVANAVIRTGARAGLEGGITGLASLGQSGYQGKFDNEKSGEQALHDAGTMAATSGIFKGATAGAGEILNATGLPAKLYQSIYKAKVTDPNTIAQDAYIAKYGLPESSNPSVADVSKDAINEMKMGIAHSGNADAAKALDGVNLDGIKDPSEIPDRVRAVLGDHMNDPAVAEAVTNHTASAQQIMDNLPADTSPAITASKDTLAEQAMNRGIKGSLNNQIADVQKGIYDSEEAIKKAAAESGARVPVDPKLQTFLASTADEFKDVGRGELADKVGNLVSNIDEKGTMSAQDAIDARRLLDQMRARTSFTNPKLVDNLKYWADDLRGSINDIPTADGKIGDINKDYSFFIKARDALVKKAVQTGNKEAVNALDEVMVGLPLAEGHGLSGIIPAIANKTVNSPAFKTNLAQGVRGMTESSPTGVGLRTLIGTGLVGAEHNADQQGQ